MHSESFPVTTITALEAWQNLQENDALLVDVRCSAEWSFVGIPDLSSLRKTVILKSWRLFPSMMVNPNFEAEFSTIDKKKPLLFICRSGTRSGESATFLATRGFHHCYNIVGGFEGDKHSKTGKRASVNGWKYQNLPWIQP